MSRRALAFTLLSTTGALGVFWACKSTQPGTSLKDDGFVSPSGKPVVVVKEPGQGSTRGSFSVTGMGSSGGSLEIVWDIVSRDVKRGIDCSKLRFRRNVTVNNGSFSFNVDDDKLFELSLDADPQGYRKLALDDLMNMQGPLRGEFCVRDQTQIAAASQPLSGMENGALALAGENYADITEYGKECVEEVGYLPPFSCLDGQPIPVMINGAELSEADYLAQKPQTCDNPVHLGLGSDGQCVPYARLVRVKTYSDAALTQEKAGVDTVVICRRYKFSAKSSPLFQDVAVVQHNKTTGATCWFQMLDSVGKDTSRVPPPHETELPSDAPSTAQKAATFWMTPAQTVNFPCVRCHDSDPYMNSPYVMKVKGWGDTPGAGGLYAQHYVPVGATKPMMPSNPNGKYYQVGKGFPFKDWPKSYAIASENDTTCTDCHRIGSLTTCQRWASYATGRSFPGATNENGKKFPLSHWMPASGAARFTENTHGADSLEDWNSTYGAGTQAILDCCANPDAAGCTKVHINKRPY